MRAGRKYGAMVGMTPTVTGPDAEDCLSVTSSLAARSSLRIVRARGRKSCPKSVSLTARPSRSKRRTPSSSSSLMICCESEGWATCSRSAAREQVAQPSLSQQIIKLEEELGVRLFDRLGRAVKLTDLGQLFLPRART